MRTSRFIPAFALVAGWLFAILCVIYPAWRAGGEVLLSFPGFLRALTEPMVLHVLWATLRQAAVSVIFAVLAGLPLGLWIAGDRRAERWLLLPGGVPTLIAASAWVLFFGRMSWSYSFTAVVSAHAFLNAPWIALRVSQARREVSFSSIEAARTLGAGAFSRFSFVIWPAVRGAFAAGVVQAFIWCSMSFTLVQILGGGPPVDTLETLLFSRIRQSGLDLTGAMACAAWQAALTFIPWLCVQKFNRITSTGAAFERTETSQRKNSWLKLFAALFFLWPYAGVLIVGLPLCLKWDSSTWAEFWPALGVSFRIASLTTVLTLLVAAVGAVAIFVRSPRESFLLKLAIRALEWILILPGGLSTLVLAMMLWLAYGGSPAAWVAVQALVFLPFALRVFWSTAQGTRGRLLDAASTLGASSFQAFRHVEWPRWRAPVSAVAATVLAAALGEVAAAGLFASETNRPLPWLMARWMWSYRFGEAEAAAALLLLVACVSALAVFYLGNDSERGAVR